MGSGSTAYTASYDAAGDMVCRAPSGATSCSGGVNTGQQLTWDTEGRLAAWQDAPTAPSTTASYLYDGEGQRVAQQVTSGGTTTTTTYVGSLAEYATTGGTTSRTDYLYAAGKLVAEAVTSSGTTTLSYLVANAQGTPLEALDGSGNVTASRLYTPYGSSRYTSGAFPTSYGYTGQRADATTGLDYYGARYYDPAIGQFTSADTVLDGLSRYGYVGGNPISRTDPSGHMGAEKERYGGSGGGRGGGLSLAFKVVAGLVVVGELAVIVMGMIIIADRSDLIVINPDGSYGERFSPGDPDYNTWSQGYNDALKDRDAWNARTAPKAIPAATTRSFPDGIGALVAGAAAAAAASSGGAPQPQPGGGSARGGTPPGGGGGGVASPVYPEDDDRCRCWYPKLYRGIRPDEDISKGLFPRLPGRNMSPAGHVGNGSNPNFKGSQFISTSIFDVFAAKYGPVVEIDVALIQGASLMCLMEVCFMELVQVPMRSGTHELMQKCLSKVGCLQKLLESGNQIVRSNR